MKKPSVILFDVNQTMLDLTPVQKKVNKILGSKGGFRIWFGLLLQHSLVDTLTGGYHDFSLIGKATLELAAAALHTKINNDDKEEAIAAMSDVQPHRDVKKGLQRLQKMGYRLATLTNSPTDSLHKQLENAGIASFFEAALSIDGIKIYKPAKESYQWAAKTLGVEPADVLMVAAHGWDVCGAMAAGMSAAFIEREGQALYSLAPAPQFVEKKITDLADALQKQFA